MTVAVCPDPEDRGAYLRWLRANTEIEGFASLCDDVCSIVARHCEEERWAIQYMMNGKINLLTAPLACTSSLDPEVRLQEWTDEKKCFIYLESTELKLSGAFSRIGRDFLSKKLAASAIEAYTQPYRLGFGENGNYRLYDSKMHLPNGKTIDEGYYHDVKHGRILIVEIDKKVYGYDDESAALQFSIERCEEKMTIRHHFMLDKNTIITFPRHDALVYDVRSAKSERICLPQPTDNDLGIFTVIRNGDVLTKSIDQTVNGSERYLLSYRFDLRGGWVPYYRVKTFGAYGLLGQRGYWG